MLSAAVVVFREVFEIVLIVGIVLAATKTMPNRMKAILIGFAAGIGGSALVAFFTGKISEMAEGLGQEYFNAGILLTAAGFIAWTVLWMKKHARHMKKHFEDVGHAVADGKAPFIVLSAVIAVALLREGSEIVLFTYGMLASGQDPLMIAAGSAMGLVSGLAVGLLLYFGLIKLSVRVFFHVTSLLLVVLVAGMASQAFGFLVAAGHFESLSRTLWDSSSLLSEDGIIGQSLGTLIGYTARPAAVQVIVYALTLGGLLVTLKMIEKKTGFLGLFRNLFGGAGAAAAIFAAIIFWPHAAHATKNVTSPYVTKGELEVEWKGGYKHDDDDSVDGEWEQKAAIAYGLTERVQIEVEGKIKNPGDEDHTTLESIALESKVQLTERGEYWVDAGIKGEYVINTNDGPDEIEVKLLLAKDTGKFSHKANIALEREVGDDSDDETQAGFKWGTRYRYNSAFEPGIELHSSFGPISDFDDTEDQEHLLGPVFYGKIGSLKYDVGYLFGLTDDGSPDGLAKAILEYEWHF